MAAFNEAWTKLATILNSGNIGPLKSIAQWKQVVSELKTNVKKKARDIYVKKKGTGGGPPPKELSETESKLYNLINPTSVEGAHGVEEIGIPTLDFFEVVTAAEIDENPEMPESNSNEENVPATSLSVPSSKATSKVRFPTKRIRPSFRTNTLEKSIECQVESTQLLAESISKLSQAIEALALAINSFEQ